MSVKAMGLVWDMPCPAKINQLEFKPNHKYVLVAYADHADHNGRNIWPAVKTIARKTGYEERTVQYITRDLEAMGILVEDGLGPRGTNKWYIPFSEGGEKISPLKSFQGANGEKSLGEIPSGEIPSGADSSPELKEQEPNENISIYKQSDSVWAQIKEGLKEQMPKASYETWIQPSEAEDFDGRTLTVKAHNSYARDWMQNRVLNKAQEIGGVFIKFVSPEMAQVEE